MIKLTYFTTTDSGETEQVTAEFNSYEELERFQDERKEHMLARRKEAAAAHEKEKELIRARKNREERLYKERVCEIKRLIGKAVSKAYEYKLSPVKVVDIITEAVSDLSKGRENDDCTAGGTDTDTDTDADTDADTDTETSRAAETSENAEENWDGTFDTAAAED